MPELPIEQDNITLAQALKATGLADSGGHAKHLIREGRATVNGGVEKHPGRKLIPGDRFQLGDRPEWIVRK